MKEKILNEIRSSQRLYTLLEEKVFQDKDIRLSFFDAHIAACVDYLHKVNYLESDIILDVYKEVLIKEELTRKEAPFQMFINSSNSSLILDTWSNFEMLISYLCEAYFSHALTLDVLNKNYNSVLKTLERNRVVMPNKGAFDKLKQTYFHKTSTNSKLFKLLKEIKHKLSKETDYNEMNLFLINYARLRNSIHSNYIYNGKEDKYEFNNTTFNYVNGKPIYISSQDEDIYLQLPIQLRKYTELIIQNTKYDSLIFDPSHLMIE